MPGAFAHMTMVLTAKNLSKLESDDGLSNTAHRAISGLTKYAELGSVSPDYPYLCQLDGDTDEWADLMHYEHTGARILRNRPDGVVKRRCLAWLMGYAAHVVTDISIHPVVKLKVGDYQGHETGHQVCEMHQDTFIYQSLNVGDITDTEHPKGGIRSCGSDDAIDFDIKTLWLGMLQAVHPEVFASNPPDIDKWHRNFKRVVDGVADEGGWLPGFVMRFIADQGFLYFPAEVSSSRTLRCLAGARWITLRFSNKPPKMLVMPGSKFPSRRRTCAWENLPPAPGGKNEATQFPFPVLAPEDWRPVGSTCQPSLF